jgi:integrase
MPDGRALSRNRLLAEIERWLTRLMGASPKLTGKAFRRGGASGMLQGGASIPEIMTAGRWRSPAMVGVYASAEAQRRSIVAASRAMDPSAASAAAAAAASTASR